MKYLRLCFRSRRRPEYNQFCLKSMSIFGDKYRGIFDRWFTTRRAKTFGTVTLQLRTFPSNPAYYLAVSQRNRRASCILKEFTNFSAPCRESGHRKWRLSARASDETTELRLKGVYLYSSTSAAWIKIISWK